MNLSVEEKAKTALKELKPFKQETLRNVVNYRLPFFFLRGEIHNLDTE